MADDVISERGKMRKEQTYMDIRDFAELLGRLVSERLGEKCQIKLQEIMKNNGVILQGLVILREESNLSPTIYLNSFLQAYEAGISLETIVDRILEVYGKGVREKNLDVKFFRSFDAVKDKICYRIINRERNHALLERIPHLDFLDLSISFYYAYHDDAIGDGSIQIYNTHLEMWGCGCEELLGYAQENTPRLQPFQVRKMQDMLKSCAPDNVEIPMLVLTTLQMTYGASCIIYPHMLEQLSEQLGENFYMIPSSIHEILLLPEREGGDVESLLAMIREINRTQVEPEDILSDNLYFYDKSQRKIQIFQ